MLCNCYLGKKIWERNTEGVVRTALCDFLHLTYTWMGQREATFALGLHITIFIFIITSSRWTSSWYWCTMRATVWPANFPLSSFLLRIFSNSQKMISEVWMPNPTECTRVWWEFHDEMRVHSTGNGPFDLTGGDAAPCITFEQPGVLPLPTQRSRVQKTWARL